MNIGGGEAADQMVRMMLTGTEVTVRLGASALKNVLAITLALAKHRKTLSGKINMGKNAPGNTGYPNVPYVAGAVPGVQAEGSQAEDPVFCHMEFGWPGQGGRCSHARHRAGARQSYF